MVNLHSSITTMLEEAKWISRLGLTVPDSLHQLSVGNVKCNYDQLKVHVHGVYDMCTCTCSYYWKRERTCVQRYQIYLLELCSFT